MTSLDGVLQALDASGPLAFQNLPASERAWRGRFFLMTVVVGASPMYAWAMALLPDTDGSDQSSQALVAQTSDDAIMTALEVESVSIESLTPY